MLIVLSLLINFCIVSTHITHLFAAEYTSFDMRDPFKVQLPLDKPQAEVKKNVEALLEERRVVSMPEIKVQGIISGGSRPQAIIRGKIMGIGDKIDNSILINKITKDGVGVVYEDQLFLIPAPAKLLKSIKGGSDEKSN